jgi:HAD superfamily hydrolase (TIGR01509 family)
VTISAVLFDMDGLLVDTEPLWHEVEHETFAILGGTWSEADAYAIMGASMAHATSYMRATSGTDRAEAEIAEMLVSGMVGRLADFEIPIQPGVAELLREVADSGIPYALVSASVRPIVDLVLAFLARSGIPAFPVSVAGDEVARSKPDPMPYLRAAELLGVDISRAIILEDSLNGVRAGEAAGGMVVAVPRVVPIDPGGRVVVRESLVGLDLATLAALLD